VLLDEPFSALDSPVRQELRRELRRLQRDAGLSTVLVTHDPEEAAFLADEILVIADGQILQAGPSREVYRQPASPTVARLLGIENLLPGIVAPGGMCVGDIIVDADISEIQDGTAVLWSVRPEQVSLATLNDASYPAVVIDIAYLGTSTALTIRLTGGPELRVRTTDPVDFLAGDACAAHIERSAISVWPDSLQPTPSR